jgi:hypothetical protein
MVVTVDAPAHAATGEGVPIGRRTHTERRGQGRTAWTERLARDVVGLTGLTTGDQEGPPQQGRHPTRRAFQLHPSPAVVVRRWHGRDDGPGGTPVFLTPTAVEKPLPPFDDDDDRRRIEHGCIPASQPPGSFTAPPPHTARCAGTSASAG